MTNFQAGDIVRFKTDGNKSIPNSYTDNILDKIHGHMTLGDTYFKKFARINRRLDAEHVVVEWIDSYEVFMRLVFLDEDLILVNNKLKELRDRVLGIK